MRRLLKPLLLAMALLLPEAAQADSFWNHNGSEMRLHSDGLTRTFSYEKPRAGIASQGVERGTVLFEGTISEQGFGDYSGVAYVFSARCGKMAYDVSGEVLNDASLISLSGKAPKRDRSTCVVQSFRDDILDFSFVRSEEPAVAYPPMVEGEICQIYDFTEYKICLEKNANEICRGRREFEDLVRCFRGAVYEVYKKSLMEGAATVAADTPFTQCTDGVCTMEGGGPSPYCLRLNTKFVRECDGDVVNERCVDVECPLRACRKICGTAEE